jgi:hypothetical protein
MARGMGATDPQALGDGLLLLLEGAFVSSQLFHEGGPAGQLAQAAGRLIDAWVGPTPDVAPRRAGD